MNISFCTVVLSLIQGIALNAEVPPCSQGWGATAKFFAEYGLKRGWSLILTHRFGSPILCVRIVDDSGCARTYSPWP
jgi:hypothetical protein